MWLPLSPLGKTKFFSLLEALVYLYTFDTKGTYVNYYHDLVVHLPLDTLEECKQLIVGKYPDVATRFYESLDIIGWL